MIIFNFLAVGMLLSALIIGTAVERLFGASDCVALFILGIVPMALDIYYRRTRGAGSMFSPSSGGQLFFIPIWIIGILFVIHAFRELNQ